MIRVLTCLTVVANIALDCDGVSGKLLTSLFRPMEDYNSPPWPTSIHNPLLFRLTGVSLVLFLVILHSLSFHFQKTIMRLALLVRSPWQYFLRKLQTECYTAMHVVSGLEETSCDFPKDNLLVFPQILDKLTCSAVN